MEYGFSIKPWRIFDSTGNLKAASVWRGKDRGTEGKARTILARDVGFTKENDSSPRKEELAKIRKGDQREWSKTSLQSSLTFLELFAVLDKLSFDRLRLLISLT